MSYADEMSEGRAALDRREYSLAYQAFARAHDLGHAIKRDHLAAHRGMISAATRGGRIDRAAKNVVLMAAAFVFDRPAVAAG